MICRTLLTTIPDSCTGQMKPINLLDRFLYAFHKNKQTDSLSSSEKKTLIALFNNLNTSNTRHHMIDMILCKKNGRKLRVHAVREPLVVGGQKIIRLAITRSKSGKLKFWVLRNLIRYNPTNPSYLKRLSLEFQITNPELRSPISLKTIFCGRQSLQRLALGGDLYSYLSQIKSGEEPLFCKKVINLCLNFWSFRFTHGDIKVENIVLDQQKNCFLIDFDLATPFDEPKSSPVVGTPRTFPRNFATYPKITLDFHALAVCLVEIYLKKNFTKNPPQPQTSSLLNAIIFQVNFHFAPKLDESFQQLRKRDLSYTDHLILGFIQSILYDLDSCSIGKIKTFSDTLSYLLPT